MSEAPLGCAFEPGRPAANVADRRRRVIRSAQSDGGRGVVAAGGTSAPVSAPILEIHRHRSTPPVGARDHILIRRKRDVANNSRTADGAWPRTSTVAVDTTAPGAGSVNRGAWQQLRSVMDRLRWIPRARPATASADHDHQDQPKSTLMPHGQPPPLCPDELRADQVRRVLHVGDLEERPSAEAAPVVDGRDPQVLGGRDLGLLLLLRLARDLEHERQEVVGPVDSRSRRRIRKSGRSWRRRPS